MILLVSLTSSWADPVSTLKQVSKQPLKTIDPLGNPEGNAMHRVHSVVSPEIDFKGGLQYSCVCSLGMSGYWDWVLSSLCIILVNHSNTSMIYLSLNLFMHDDKATLAIHS
jgi:hypothetical protein